MNLELLNYAINVNNLQKNQDCHSEKIKRMIFPSFPVIMSSVASTTSVDCGGTGIMEAHLIY
jgi:hypothetical protein